MNATATSYLSAFRQHLENDPERPALHGVSLTGDRLSSQAYTYENLADMAWRFSQGLAAQGVGPGDRVLLCLEQPQHILACILGGLVHGYVPVPLPAVGELGVPKVFLQRIQAVAADCGPRLVVVEKVDRWDKMVGDGDVGVRPCSVESLLTATSAPRPDGWLVDDRGQHAAFLQYTSGSTGTPRGVVVTPDNILANVTAIGTATRVGPGDSMVSWLPLHHDMGLVGGLLFPVFWGMPTYILAPWHFVVRPACWLKAISQFRATYSVAPNFAYSLCLNKLAERDLEGLDLSTWRLAFNGAEPIDADTLRGFATRFEPVGFRRTALYPVYGLAEATLAAAMPPAGRPLRTDDVDRTFLSTSGRARPSSAASTELRTFVSVGQAVPGHVIRIMDPESGLPCADRQIGEIVVEGPSITPGYFGDSQVRTALKTGDLGYVAEGWIYIIDRLKDLIIIAGQNFAPSDIEICASRVIGVRKGRVVAFSAPGSNGTDELHLVAELDTRTWQSEARIRTEITETVNRWIGVRVASVRLVPPGTVPLTSSGKVQRKACRQSWADGKLPPGVGLWRRANLMMRTMLRSVASL